MGCDESTIVGSQCTQAEKQVFCAIENAGGRSVVVVCEVEAFLAEFTRCRLITTPRSRGSLNSRCGSTLEPCRQDGRRHADV